MPEFTEEEKQMIQGSYDFFAINGYTSRIVSYELRPLDGWVSWEFDRDTTEVKSNL